MSRFFRNPVFLLALAAGLIAFAVQSGDTGTADARHRLQSAHALWTGEPPVFPDEYPEFGVHGRDGKIQSWYGIGQSLLMLPADVVGTALERLPVFADYNGNDPDVRAIVVSYSVNILLSVFAALVCFRFLRQLAFNEAQAMAGVLALLLLTTHLHYTQNMQENNYIFLLTLSGFSFQYEWFKTGSRRALLIGSGALGLNLLTRVTTGMDLLAGGFFILLLCWSEARSRIWMRLRSYVAIALPVYLFFGVVDRLYQFYRFGSFFGTYIGAVAREARMRDPSLPLSYPFTTPMHTGVFGALFTPEKSIFLFDPLIVLMLLIAVVGWMRFSSAIKAYLVSVTLLLAAYLCFYARYFAWAGDFAWGDRYVSTTVELATLLAVPLMMKLRAQLGRFVTAAGAALMAWSLVVQLSSVTFWLPLEIYQMMARGHPTFVIGLRLKNIVAFALGKMDAWGLSCPQMKVDPWDYVHITTWNLLPFQLQRVGQAPGRMVDLTFVVWMASVAACALVLWRLFALMATREDRDSQD